MISKEEKVRRGEMMRRNIVSDCPTLYGRRFCFECDDGWLDEIRRLSVLAESLNMVAAKLGGRAKISASQVKEKFGTLRFYYSVEPVMPTPFRQIDELADFLLRKLGYFGKIAIYKAVPRAIVRLVAGINRRIAYAIPFFGRKYNVISNALDEAMDSLVRDAEKRCFSRCEKCGDYIGTDYEKRCNTTGWIKYLCEDCAKASGVPYVMDGKPYEFYQMGFRVDGPRGDSVEDVSTTENIEKEEEGDD